MKISVITASYNYENFIAETIEAVIKQDYQDWELVIVDDGSSDDSLSVIKAYLTDSRIKLYCHENNQNKGLAETVKLGLSKCNGDYIAFLEADDIWNPSCLSARARVIEQYPDIAIIANAVELFGDAERIATYKAYFELQERCFNKLNFPCNIFPLLLKENLIPTFSSAMVKAEYLRKCDFDVAYQPWLDRYLWLQIAYERKFYYLDRKLTGWRIHAESYIKKEANTYKSGNDRKIYSLVKCVFKRETNPISRSLKTCYYYLKALNHKYARALVGRIKRNILIRKIRRLMTLLVALLQVLTAKFAPSNNNPANEVLIIPPLRFGDFCMWLPLARPLIEFFKKGDNKVTLLLPGNLKALAETLLEFDSCIVNPYPAYLTSIAALHKFKNRLRSCNFSAAVSMSVERSFFYNDLPLIYTQAPNLYLPEAVNLSERFFRCLPFIMDKFYFKHTSPLKDHVNKTELDNYYEFTKSIINSEPQLRPLTFKSLPETVFTGNFIVLVPGSLDISRSWGQEKYRKLAVEILKIHKGKIVIVGSSGELALGDYIAAGCDRIINYCGKTSLLELAGLISKAKLVVGNDSGVANLAVILGKKACVITAYANERFMFVPERFKGIGLEAPTVCRQQPPCPFKGCNFHCHYPNRGKPYPCVEEISVDDFLKVVRNTLFSV